MRDDEPERKEAPAQTASCPSSWQMTASMEQVRRTRSVTGNQARKAASNRQHETNTKGEKQLKGNRNDAGSRRKLPKNHPPQKISDNQ